MVIFKNKEIHSKKNVKRLNMSNVRTKRLRYMSLDFLSDGKDATDLI